MRPVITLGLAGLSGAIFSVGLAISGMLNPARIVGFLDVAGSWDPTLVLVMASAVLSYGAAFWSCVAGPLPPSNSPCRHHDQLTRP